VAEVIPLFPLGTVLFPGLVLPLRVFEERYTALVADLRQLPDESRHFGVVAIRAGWEVGVHGVSALYGVGTTARVRSVQPTDDGCFELATVGERRFRLLSVDATSKPYLLGEVEWLGESEADDSAGVVAPFVADAFVGYVCDLAHQKAALRAAEQAQAEQGAAAQARAEQGAADAMDTPTAARAEEDPAVPMRDVRMPDDTRVLSYMVAASVPLDLADQQSLLEAATVTDRLRAELRLIRRERALLAQLNSVPVPLARFAAKLSPN